MLVYSGKDDPQLSDSGSSGDQQVSENRTLLPFAYGIADDPFSRSLGAVEENK